MSCCCIEEFNPNCVWSHSHSVPVLIHFTSQLGDASVCIQFIHCGQLELGFWEGKSLEDVDWTRCPGRQPLAGFGQLFLQSDLSSVPSATAVWVTPGTSHVTRSHSLSPGILSPPILQNPFGTAHRPVPVTVQAVPVPFWTNAWEQGWQHGWART